MSTDCTNAEHPDTFDARADLTVGDRTYEIFNITAPALSERYDIARLPYSIKVLLENLLRHEDGPHVSADDIVAVANWGANPEGHGQGAGDSAHEIAFTPERVLMQDFTGVPAVVDLAAMRDALARLGGNASQVNPLVPVELVIDHSVIIEESGDASAYDTNVSIEYGRNMERYQLLRWAQGAFRDFRAVPPGMGICHQVNLEYLSRLVFATEDGRAFCDSLVGTDSHTVMVNGLGVLGWGVGGIEAEAAMLGQPLSMLLPPVVGLRISGETKPGITATDVVLTVTELLRDHGVVGAFVECYGPGVGALPLETRATIGNMSPEYGATCTMFPIDQVTIDYLRFTGRDDEHLELVEAYAKAQGLWHDPDAPEPVYSEHVTLDLGDVEPSLAGPARPQDRVALSVAGDAYRVALDRAPRTAATEPAAAPHHQMTDGDVVIAAITSCTNTSNPQVMVAAGLVAKKAVERGLRSKPWVKTSLAPGSRVVTDYLERAGLTEPLQQLGFYLVGYGCTTCIGNSGPLLDGVTDAVKEGDLSVASVLSGNRNFEGRIHPDVRLNYLASPPLVVAYALAGTIDIDLTTTPLGDDADGNPVLLSDLWPSMDEVSETIRASLTSDMFRTRYSAVFDGDEYWQQVSTADGETYSWQDDSTYVQNPPVLRGHDDDAGAGDRHRRRPGAGPAGRQRHHRPHLPRRLHRPDHAGRPLPHRPRRGAPRLQLLRRAPGQPRGDDARHVRQRAAAQPAGARHRGRRDPAPARRHRDLHFRGGHAVRRRGRPARRAGGPRVRDGQQPRLGGQGHRPARRARRHRPELRAHPPLQPHRHGRRPAAVLQGRLGAEPGADRARALRHQRPRGREQRRAAQGADRDGHGRRRLGHRVPRRSCASTRRWRPSTTATAAFCSTCCARWPGSPHRD